MIIEWTAGAVNQDVQGGAYGSVWNWCNTPIVAVGASRTWPISKPRSGRTWESEGDSRTWGVPADKNRNV